MKFVKYPFFCENILFSIIILYNILNNFKIQYFFLTTFPNLKQ